MAFFVGFIPSTSIVLTSAIFAAITVTGNTIGFPAPSLSSPAVTLTFVTVSFAGVLSAVASPDETV